MKVEINLDEPKWSALDLPNLTVQAGQAVAKELSLPDDLEIALLACDDARIQTLNDDFRDKDAATNVLSWPAQERSPGPNSDWPDLDIADPEIGDIAMAFETCAREAVAQEKSLNDHVTHLFVHGVLHLLGFDHQSDQEAATMEALETRILAKLDIDDPY